MRNISFSCFRGLNKATKVDMLICRTDTPMALGTSIVLPRVLSQDAGQYA